MTRNSESRGSLAGGPTRTSTIFLAVILSILNSAQAHPQALQAEWVIWVEEVASPLSFHEDRGLRPDSDYLLIGDLRLRRRGTPWAVDPANRFGGSLNLSVQPLARFSAWLEYELKKEQIAPLSVMAVLEPTFMTSPVLAESQDGPNEQHRLLFLDLPAVRDQLDSDAVDMSLGTVSYPLRSSSPVSGGPLYLFLYWEADGERMRNEAYFPLPQPGLSATNAAVQPPEEIKRYATVETPSTVTPGSEFAVQVSLTRELLTPEAGIHPKTLPVPRGTVSPIDVVLTGPGFLFRNGVHFNTILAHHDTDSTPALFYLKAPTDGPPILSIYTSFYHHSRFLFRVSRRISVTSSTPTHAVSPEEPSKATLTLTRPTPDLTVQIVAGRIILTSPGLRPRQDAYEHPEGLGQFLQRTYGTLVGAVGRNVRPQARAAAQDTANGIGRHIYQKFAPKAFKEEFWFLVDKLGPDFHTIQIYSDDPLLPWELMIPVSKGRERTHLGLEFQIGRWHARDDAPSVASSRGSQDLSEILLIAPRYEPPLAALEGEAKTVDSFPAVTVKRPAANRDSLRKALRILPNGILHFAGHGVVSYDPDRGTTYAILLEDGQELSLDAWRGMVSSRQTHAPLVFFNACDTGQTQRVVNFVEGWAPAFLDAGAAAYVSALWPVSDMQAAAFARVFYGALAEEMRTGPASVLSALAKARSLYHDTGNPTFLAYVYYGDPYLTMKGVPDHRGLER